jgi:hypothetical protein
LSVSEIRGENYFQEEGEWEAKCISDHTEVLQSFLQSPFAKMIIFQSTKGSRGIKEFNRNPFSKTSLTSHEVNLKITF